jgi:8-oxo-dGTP diphosphatase
LVTVTIIPTRHRRSIPAEERAFLAQYDPQAFAAVAVTVDVAILTIREDQLSVLLVERADHPYKGYWAVPGGFLREGEDADAAAARELEEETAVRANGAGVHLEQLKTYAAPGRDPRMRIVTVAYLALMPNVSRPHAGGDAAAARFWPVSALGRARAPRIAFDHAQILNDAIERARAKLEYTSLATSFLEAPFTLSDLRHVYEVVWGVELDPANFRRKVLSTPRFVEPLGSREARMAPGRPADLYLAGGVEVLPAPMSRPFQNETSHAPSTSRRRRDEN